MTNGFKTAGIWLGQIVSVALVAGGVFAGVMWGSSDWTDNTMMVYTFCGLIGGFLLAGVMHLISGFSLFSGLAFLDDFGKGDFF